MTEQNTNYEEIIVRNTLQYLDGWIINDTDDIDTETEDNETTQTNETSTSESEITSEEIETLFIEEETLTDADFNKKISKTEILDFYNTAESHAKAYLGFSPSATISTLLSNFICMWSAGLIYKKYDIRPNDQIDESYPVGYGDQLIITAKTGLKPYKKYQISIW